MADQPAQVFLSYNFSDREIHWLREELQLATDALTGEPSINITIGEHWPIKIEDASNRVPVLIPIMTPAYFRSQSCRADAEAFLDAERQMGRADLVLPIYFVTSDELEQPQAREGNDLAQELFKRQYADWRDLASEPPHSPLVKERVEQLARKILSIANKSAPPIPEQKSTYRFQVNEQGQIERAPDDAPEVDDADPEMLDRQAGLLDASSRFLGPFRESGAGGNVHDRLIKLASSYEAAISGPLSQINYSEVWRLGSRLQNARDAAEREIERLDDFPQLENDQKAALDDLLKEHGPFIFNTSAGREQQSLADRFNATQVDQEAKRAAGQAFSDAVQAEDTLYDVSTRQVVAEISAEQGKGRHPERHAVIADTTYQNLLAVTGKVAKWGAVAAAGGVIGNAVYDTLPLAKDIASLSQPTIEAARAFWLANQSILVALATASGEGLAWLPSFNDWLRVQTQAGDPKRDDAPAPVANTLWTPGHIFRDIEATWCPEMVVIPSGKFLMGSPENEEGRRDNEGPQHLVTIKKPFALGRYPVTFEEYDVFCDETGRDKPKDRDWGRGRRPVINVNFDDAEAYCAWLSEVTGGRYQLPSEAMWEYACRAGTTTAYAFGDALTKEHANFGSTLRKTSEVGAYPANAWKLHDMHGNVLEWCQDWYHESYEGTPDDGSAWLDPPSTDRVVRGGSWNFSARFVRSAFRSWGGPGYRDDGVLGFRCAGVQEQS